MYIHIDRCVLSSAGRGLPRLAEDLAQGGSKQLMAQGGSNSHTLAACIFLSLMVVASACLMKSFILA